jgi:hypothetical protein
MELVEDVDAHHSASEHESEDEGGVPLPTRGLNRKYSNIRSFPDMEEAELEFTIEKRIENDQVLGRSSSNAKIYNCNMVSCGCNKVWRLSHLSPKESDEVILQESVGDHINHEFFTRNGGRGLSFKQAAYVVKRYW